MTGGSVLITRIPEPHYQPRHNEPDLFLLLIQLLALQVLHQPLELLLPHRLLMLRDALRGEQLLLLDREQV
jgi:hypothetical protein